MTLLLALMGCALITVDDVTRFEDQDRDGTPWADDCDDNNGNVGGPRWLHADLDGDGFGDAESGSGCDEGPGLTFDGTDCDDTDPAQHPGATPTAPEWNHPALEARKPAVLR